MHKDIQFRPVTNDDMGLLLQIYASTRELELQQTDWSDEQKQMFVAMQFNAQHSFYMEYYSDASFEIILHSGIPAGRLYLLRSPKELLIVDITLLPAFRGLGIGSEILGNLMREAAETGRALMIHVERFNPALRLYTRLGFQLIEDRGVYLYMGWNIGGDQPNG
ncbi:MAG: GNAT family N-acetyltransferase [Sideroxydans sp.]|nr:GNAT family N-acetyltransferase [Sideroxydans sp.]